MKILGIESSCDETAAAVVEDGKIVLTNVIASSTLMHRKYGGIVPEVAARKQVESIIPVLTETMNGINKDDIDAIAVTVGPGLIGSLLVGVETAKTLAFAWNKPIIPVNHVIAHMYANFISSQSRPKADQPMVEAVDSSQFKKTQNDLLQTANYKLPTFPAISLVVSGGHTELFLMTDGKTLKWLGGTLDDAAGEAFDKTARLLGFENRGGQAIQEAAQELINHNSPSSPSYLKVRGLGGVRLPRPLMDDSLNFSFSGLKTAILREVNKLKTMKQWNNQTINYLAYETQEAITDVLVAKTLKAAKQYKVKSVLISGGVAANTRLRQKFELSIINLPAGKQGSKRSINLLIPPVSLCTDNAVCIASYAYFHQNQQQSWKSITASPNMSVEI